jgi:hypothetical protein
MPRNQKDESEIIVQYLVGIAATPRLNASYHLALQNIPVSFSAKEKKLWDACLSHPWMLPHVDAWLGFNYPDHPIRKKLFIMLGLLETQPEYCNFFIPSRYSFLHLFAVGFTCVWALFKIVAGRLITWII